MPTEAEDLAWYHTIDLPGGVATAGRYDTRHAATRIPMPASLAGKRCLDVGCADGFWAFEMERRGAAEVVAVDIAKPADGDWPNHVRDETRRRGNPGVRKACFELAAGKLGSSVQRQEINIYDLSPERLGRFDFVFLGALLIHLRDPAGALAAVHDVTDGQFLCLETVSLPLSLVAPFPVARLRGLNEPLWWFPNVKAVERMMQGAGFEIQHTGRPFRVAYGKNRRPRSPEFSRARELAFRYLREPLGAPHAAILARSTHPQPSPGPRQGEGV